MCTDLTRMVFCANPILDNYSAFSTDSIFPSVSQDWKTKPCYPKIASWAMVKSQCRPFLASWRTRFPHFMDCEWLWQFPIWDYLAPTGEVDYVNTHPLLSIYIFDESFTTHPAMWGQPFLQQSSGLALQCQDWAPDMALTDTLNRNHLTKTHLTGKSSIKSVHLPQSPL